MRIRQWSAFGAVLTAAALLGCAAEDAAEEPAEAPAVAPAEQPAVDPAAAPAGAAGSAEQIAAGKQVFETQTCYTCHGMDASGTALAPNLTDDVWINTDGTMEGIESVVRNGVATPKEHPAPMPAMGGAQLSDEQVASVVAYVYSLSNGG